MPALNTTPKVKKPYFSDLEKHDIQSFTNTPPFFVVTRALNLVVMNQMKEKTWNWDCVLAG
jgi:hypothetical protein